MHFCYIFRKFIYKLPSDGTVRYDCQQNKFHIRKGFDQAVDPTGYAANYIGITSLCYDTHPHTMPLFHFHTASLSMIVIPLVGILKRKFNLIGQSLHQINTLFYFIIFCGFCRHNFFSMRAQKKPCFFSVIFKLQL